MALKTLKTIVKTLKFNPNQYIQELETKPPFTPQDISFAYLILGIKAI